MKGIEKQIFATPEDDIYRRCWSMFDLFNNLAVQPLYLQKGKRRGSEELLSLLQQMNGGGGWRVVCYRLTRFECEFYFAIKSAELMLTQQFYFNEPSFYAAAIVN